MLTLGNEVPLTPVPYTTTHECLCQVGVVLNPKPWSSGKGNEMVVGGCWLYDVLTLVLGAWLGSLSCYR